MTKRSYKLKLKNNKKKIKWYSSDTYVAKVSKKGTVTAKNEGKAKITAKIGKKKYKCTVKVEDPYIGTDNGNRDVEVGERIRYYMCRTSYKGYKWKSSDTAVATIDSSGIVTGRSVGSSVIYAYVRGKKLTNTVYVSKPSIKRYVSITATNHNCYSHATLNVINKGTEIIRLDATAFIYDSWDSSFIYSCDFDDDCIDYKYIIIKPGQTKNISYSSNKGIWYLGSANYSFDFYYGNEFHSYSINVDGSNERLS